MSRAWIRSGGLPRSLVSLRRLRGRPGADRLSEVLDLLAASSVAATGASLRLENPEHMTRGLAAAAEVRYVARAVEQLLADVENGPLADRRALPRPGPLPG